MHVYFVSTMFLAVCSSVSMDILGESPKPDSYHHNNGGSIGGSPLPLSEETGDNQTSCFGELISLLD